MILIPSHNLERHLQLGAKLRSLSSLARQLLSLIRQLLPERIPLGLGVPPVF